MKRTKIIIFALLCAILFAVLLPTTAATFQDREKTNNQISIGYNDIQIVEDFETPKSLTVGENSYHKAVRVENTGKGTCYVRVMAEFSDSDVESSSKFSSDSVNYYPAAVGASDSYVNHLPDGWVYIDKSTNETLGGYYYYQFPVTNGSSTTELFTDVKTNFEFAYQVRAYNIIIYAESVQYKDVDGEVVGYLEAWERFLTQSKEGTNP